MTRLPFRIVSLVAALAIGVASFSSSPTLAQDGPPRGGQGGPGGRGPGGPGGGAAATLEGSMKAMNRAFKAIARQIDDATKDEATLKLVSDLQSATAAAKGQLPDGIAKLEGEAKAKASSEYRGMMLKSLKDTIELEEALIAGNREAAKAAYAKIDAQMKEGHKAYRVKE